MNEGITLVFIHKREAPKGSLEVSWLKEMCETFVSQARQDKGMHAKQNPPGMFLIEQNLA